MRQLVIIDYGSGNLRSAAKALERAAQESGADHATAVTDDPARVRDADRIVLPGVGAFGDCREGLYALPGMVEALAWAVRDRGRPFLGICVGMQLLATRGLEHGTHPGLDWIPGEVAAIEPEDPALKIPHMGWNELEVRAPAHPVLAGLAGAGGPAPHVYFVHSYAFHGADPACEAATVDYGGRIVAAVARDNMIGTQFHPEKSQAVGLRLLANFLRWSP